MVRVGWRWGFFVWWEDKMNYKLYSHRYGVEIVENSIEMSNQFEEIKSIILSISDEELIRFFETNTPNQKSLSVAINKILEAKFVACGWNPQSYIFNDSRYRERKNDNWRLDFAKDDISIEVAFNHGEAVAWNLIKPVLASELNHIEKSIQTKVGVVICATDDLKKIGGFDGAAGTFAKYVSYSKALMNILTTPLIIIGLEAPGTFKIEHTKVGNKKIGRIVKIENEP